MRVPASQYIDHPSYPVLQELTSYWGISSGAGAADGTTIVDTALASEPSYQNHLVKILSGDAFGQVRKVVNDTTAGTGFVVVDRPFTDSAGAVVQITASTLYVILSIIVDEDILYYGTATAAGAVDGSTLVDTGLATPFTIDDEPIGHTIRILTSSDATLIGQRREIYDYDVGTTTLVLNPRFITQVPVDTTYIVLADRPSGGGGPIPPPEPAAEETGWILADHDNFDVADATADTERWSSEYQAGAADGSADINTTTAGALRVNITAAALAAAQYGVRRLWPQAVRKFITLTDLTLSNIVTDANEVWGGIAISRGIAWDTNNWIAIYKAQSNATERIRVEYNLAGAGAVQVNILNTTQDALAFKIERENTIWRLYYSLTQAPRHYWILAAELEDPTNSMTDQTSIYLTISNPEDAVGQRVSADFLRWEYYETLGNLGDIINLLNIRGGALAYLGYCPPGMAASTTVVVCPNLAGFGNDLFNSGYQMIVLRNANSLGAAPEMEMRDIQDYVSTTGTFTTEAFSSNVEASDIVLIIHNSVAKNVSAFGIADAGSDASTIRDAARTEANDYWNGQQVMMLSGSARGQVRPIYDFVAATDDILVTPAFGAAIAAGDIYIILTQYQELVPAADATLNLLPSDVQGSKTSTAVYAKDAVSDVVRYLKGILDATITAWGTADAGSGVGAIVDATRTEADDWWNGQTILMLTGAAAFQKRPILDFVAATDTITPAPNFDAAVGAGDIYVILAHYNLIVPRAADNTANQLTSDVVGRQDDTIPAMNVAPPDATIVRLLKAIMERVGATPADPDDSLLTSAGQRDATATLDDLSDVTTTDIQAKLRRILLRMSSDAFTATIQGVARTELDTMLAQLATYFSAVGAAMSLQVNGNAARTNLEQAIEDFTAVFGADGVNVFNPTIQGAARTDLDTALNILATYLTAAGAAMSIQVNGNAARDNLEQAFEDLTAVFGADGANVFNPTIQGAARTDLDAALAQLAIYFAAAGAAMSVQVNGGAARANLELILEDYFAVVGCDGANVFSSTIQGVARTTIEAAFDGLAAYFVAAGAAMSVTMNPGAGARANLQLILQDLADMLAGGTGIITMPNAAAPANDVSLAEIIRFISDSGRVATVYTASASSVTSITAAALSDIAGNYVGQMVVPLAGNMQGQGMVVTGYDGTSVLTVDPGWAQAPGSVAFAIVPAAGYIYIKAIFDMVNGIQTLKETGGSITTDGTEQTAYINNAPAGVYRPVVFTIDLTNMAAGDEIHVRVYYRIVSGGGLINEVNTTYTGAQDPDLAAFNLHPNRFGVQITVQRTALGVDRAYQWAVIYED